MSDPVVLHGNTKSKTAIIIHAVFLEPAKRQCSVKCSNWLKAKLVPLEGGGMRGCAEIGYYEQTTPAPIPLTPLSDSPPTPEIESESWSSCCCENEQSTKLESGLFQRTKSNTHHSTTVFLHCGLKWKEMNCCYGLWNGPSPPPTGSDQPPFYHPFR